MTWPFGELRPLSYDLIMADPPWRFDLYSDAGEAKSPQAQYSTMSIAEIAALPVSYLAAGDALLWLWATHPMIDRQIEVCRAWGFRYATSGVWVKRTTGGALSFGTGYRLRSASEPFLIGVIGNPRTARTVRTVVEGVAREHSRKPDEAYAAAEILMPGARRADLFARQRRPGWDGWGNEIEKFEVVA